jgi:hypothetical protein
MFIKVLQALFVLAALALPAFAQGYKTELETPEKVSLVVKNLEGRVCVVAS